MSQLPSSNSAPSPFMNIYSSESIIKESIAGNQHGPEGIVIGYMLDDLGIGSFPGRGRFFSVFHVQTNFRVCPGSCPQSTGSLFLQG
jgi:hypothetical protein